MSKSEYERAWGTAGWLDDHEFMGDGRTVRCQRKTKAYDLVAAATRTHGAAVCIKAVYRKTFVDGDELCAAFLYGVASRSAAVPSGNALGHVAHVVEDLVVHGDAASADATTFLYDVPSGYWRAIVVFKKEAK